PVIQELRLLWETALPWLEAQQHRYSNDSVWLRDLSVSYNKLGDVYRAIGEGQKALEFYNQSMQIAERLYKAEPHRADLARDLSVSYSKLGDVYRATGEGQKALEFYNQSMQIRERLYKAEPHRADLARDLSISYERMGDVYRAIGEGQKA